MNLEHKGAWIQLFLTPAAYLTYLALLTARADGAPLVDTAYGDLIAWTIGGTIVVGILLMIIVTIAGGKDSSRSDIRDKQINRLGDQAGGAFVIIGAVGAMILAIVEVDPFWIANAIYLAFVLSGITGSVARLAMYRWGVPSW